MTEPERRTRTRDPKRREKILDAARTLFHERGFAAVSVDEIGEAAGTTGASVYRYYSNKEELLVMIFDAAQDQYLRAVPQPRDDPHEELALLVDRHVRITLEHRDLATIWAYETRAISETHLRRTRERTRHYGEVWIDLLERAYPGRRRRDYVAAALAAIGNPITLATRHDLEFDDGQADIIINMTISGLGALTMAPDRPLDPG